MRQWYHSKPLIPWHLTTPQSHKQTTRIHRGSTYLRSRLHSKRTSSTLLYREERMYERTLGLLSCHQRATRILHALHNNQYLLRHPRTKQPRLQRIASASQQPEPRLTPDTERSCFSINLAMSLFPHASPQRHYFLSPAVDLFP